MKVSRRSLLALLGAVPLIGVLHALSRNDSTPIALAQGGNTRLVLAVDMVWGAKNLPPEMRGRYSCVLTSRFPRNAQMVWRARVTDPATGELMNDSGLDDVKVTLDNGEQIKAVYGLHPKDVGEGFWTASWVIPKDYPTGTINYTFTATDKQGRSGEWKPFSTPTSLPIVLDEVLPDPPA